MSASSKRQSTSGGKIARLLKLLNEQHRVIVAAGGNKQIISEYSALIRFLKSASAQELDHIFSTPSLLHSQQFYEPELAETELVDISRSEVEKLIGNEATPRRYLESIAIHRFKVPRGSMRSFSSRGMLVEKLQTMLRNEQAHAAIETVARRHA